MRRERRVLQSYKTHKTRLRGNVKINFWLDGDVYVKLQALKEAKPHLRYTDIFVDAIHQYVVKYGATFPRRRRISVSLTRHTAYVLRLAKLKLHVTERDIVNLALRAYRPEESVRFRE
jgi:hypothetical protein